MQFEITEEMRADYRAHYDWRRECSVPPDYDDREVRLVNALRDAVAWGLRLEWKNDHGCTQPGSIFSEFRCHDNRHNWQAEQWRQEAHRLLGE